MQLEWIKSSRRGILRVGLALYGVLGRSLSDSLTSQPFAVVVAALMRMDRFFEILNTPIAVLGITFVVVVVSVFLYVDKVTVTSDSTPAPTPGGLVLFSDPFDRDADTFVPPWDVAQRAATDRLTTDSTMVRKGTHSAKFRVHNSDALAGTTNPRAQLAYQGKFCEGDDLYLGWSWYLPSNFPTSMPSGSWINIGEIGFGPPWGAPPLHFAYRGSSIALVNYNQNGGWRDVASFPAQRGQWQDVVAHVKFSKSTSVGFVELWENGQPVRMSNGSTRQYMNTINQNASGCGGWLPTLYRSKGYWEWLTLYYDEAKVGTSYAAVAP